MNRKILVVDDTPVDLAMASKTLADAEVGEILTAPSAERALEIVRSEQPVLVVTDMQMPGMNGLELVETIREETAFIPTVLITAHGSEDLAIAALESGAASYVRKQDMASRLVKTVFDILSVTRTVQQEQKLRLCWANTKSQFRVNNDAEVVPAIVSHLQEYTVNMRQLDKTESFRIGVALQEAISNAINHGNLELSSELRETGEYYKLAETRRRSEPFGSRHVHIEAEDRLDSTCYVIRDEGPGFRHQEYDYDPQDPANISRLSGRGMLLMRTFMDEVRFNEAGNEITLIHRNKNNHS